MPNPRRPVAALPDPQTVMLVGDFVGHGSTGRAITGQVISVNRSASGKAYAPGSGLATASGAAISASLMFSEGSGSLSILGTPVDEAAGSAIGSGTATAVGASIAAAVISASGAATATGATA